MENAVLDFSKARVQVMDLQTLKKTFRENDVLGKPLRGMYHYDLIDSVGDILLQRGLKMQIDEIFAAQSADRNVPGVTISPEVEKKKGVGSPESHLLRRVYANISVHDFDSEELTTNVAIAWHQSGIQIAYGPQVKICHNLCILGANRIFSTGKGMGIDAILEKFSYAMDCLRDDIITDIEVIERMKRRVMSPAEILGTIGTLTAMRVAHDTKYADIRKRELYPLNQCQINKFTEQLLLKQKQQEVITAWDVYNVGTEILKPDTTEIPLLLNQHLALSEYMQSLC